MNFFKISFFIIIFSYIFSLPTLLAQDFKIPEVTSTTFLTQDLETSNPDIEIFTAQDIKLLGINNLPDLLNLVTGLNIVKVNKSTNYLTIRGFPSVLKVLPKILIDGMELSENIYNEVYLYNFPVEISDIDRIEIIKNNTITGAGINNIAGIINIVTKSPEELDANYLYQEIGSKEYKKTFFSLNRYLNGIYFKLNGSFKQVNVDISNMKHLNLIHSSLFLTKYFNNSKLSIKFNYGNEDINILDSGVVNFPGFSTYPISYSIRSLFKNMKYYDFLINYKIKNFDVSLYTYSYRGDVGLYGDKESNYLFTNREFYKFILKKEIHFKNNKIRIGGEGEYFYAHNVGTSMKRFQSNLFFEDTITFNQYLSFLGYINFDRTKNLGAKTNYKLSLKFQNFNRDFSIRAGYAESFQKPFMGYQYQSFQIMENIKDYNLIDKLKTKTLSVSMINNKNISSYKLKSYELALMKKFNDLKFYLTTFYNLVYNTPALVGKIKKTETFEAIITPINHRNLHCYGFDSKMEFNWSNYKFFVSYLHQFIKNTNIDYIVTQDKITSAFMFNLDIFSGSVSAVYYSKVKYVIGDIDAYLSINTSISKYFFNKKLEASLYITNIFNDIHREQFYGDKIGREIYLKVQFNF